MSRDVEMRDDDERPRAEREGDRKEEREGTPRERVAEVVRGRAPAEESEESAGGLFATKRAEELRDRWTEVQAQFVDDPRAAVKAADSLVEEVLRDLDALFSEERARLDEELSARERLDTEQLRVAVRRYRAFFEKLLAI